MLGNTYRRYYQDLRLNYEELAALPEPARKKKIRKTFLNLARICHPDRNDDHQASLEFQKVYTAHQILMNQTNADKSHSYQFRKKGNYTITKSIFDLRMASAYKDRCAEMIREFAYARGPNLAEIENEYGNFIDLVEGYDLRDFVQEGQWQLEFQLRDFKLTWLRRWREYMLSLFAEELLSDFDYRDMLTTGLAWQHMAWRKVLMPLKWLAALVLTLTNTVISLYNFCMDNSVKFLYKFYQGLRNEYQNYKDGHNVNYYILVGSAVALLASGVFLFSPLFTSIFIIFSSCLLFEKLSLILATPANYVLRPLSLFIADHYWAQCLAVATLITATALVGAAIVWVPAIVALAAQINTRYILAAGLAVFDLVVSGLMPYYLYKVQPTLGTFVAAFLITRLLINVTLLPGAYLAIASNPLLLFITLSTNLALVEIFKIVSDPEAHQRSIFERLPLPNVEIRKKIKNTVLKHAPFTFWSNDLFYTGEPTSHPAQKAAERTYGSQFKSFFGGIPSEPAVRKPEAQPYHDDDQCHDDATLHLTALD
jgi:DnaJ domain